MTLAPQCYAEDVVDHVGRIKFRGHEGVRRSTVLYRKLFDDLAFDVVRRPVRLWGITISRLREGRIVEDWSAFDGLELLRALGIVRTLLVAPRFLGPLRRGRGEVGADR
jgi:hypothetical protein